MGALKCGTLHMVGTTRLVANVIFAETCEGSLRDSLGLRGAMQLCRKGRGGAPLNQRRGTRLGKGGWRGGIPSS